MKKIILAIVIILSIVPSALAQQRSVKVTLKNGTTITGTVKSFDPLETIVVNVAGFDSTIPMDKVEKVEDMSISQNVQNNNLEDIPTKDNPLIVTDDGVYPDSIIIDIAGVKYPFVLVRGGDYLMGYDGDGSMKMNSEPVHRVKVSSFYISKWLLSTYEVQKLQNKKLKKAQTYTSYDDKDILGIISLIDKYTKLPIRLPLEVEWEYAARYSKKNEIFQVSPYVWELCQDIYSNYDNGAVLLDPVGVGKTDARVCRAFLSKSDLPYKRLSSSSIMEPKTIRLAIKAKDFLK